MDQQPLEESGSFFDELTGTISLWIIVVLGITSIALVPAFYFIVRNNAAAMGSGVTLVASVVSFALVRRGRTTAGNAIFFAVFILIINGVAYASLAVPEQYAAALISVIGLLLVVTAPTGILIHPMYPVVAGVISTALIGFFVVRSGIPTLIQRIPIFVVVILFNSGVSYVVSVVTRKLVDRTARANERSNKAIRELTGIIRAMDGLRAPLEETRRQSRDYLDQIETIIATYVETVDTISAEAVTMSDRVSTARDNLSRLTDAVNDVNVRLAEQERLVQDTGDARLRLETSLRENADSIKETKHATDQLEEASRAGDARIEEVFQRIQLLEERQSRLLEINEVISTIAEQTGLLAMNAAIEAAHAGEAGRGFAVVASEVGKLAADTNERSAEITRLIREMRETIEVTSTGAHEARRALEEINVRVQAVHNGIDATQKQSETFIRFGESLAGNLEALNQNTHHIENRSTEEQTVLREYETSFGDLTRNLGHLAERIAELADHNQRGTVIMRNLANVRERTGATDEEVSSLIERSLAVTIDDRSPV